MLERDMAGLDAAEIRAGADYERARGAARAEAIELRRRRRIHLGDLVSLVFENRLTLRAAAEEALRADRSDDPAATRAEASRFASLLPRPGGLAASLYLDLADSSELAGLADDVEAIAGSVRLEVAGAAAATEVIVSRSSAPAAYLRFALTGAQREAWLEGAPVGLAVSHPRCAAVTALSDEQRAALALDLGEDGG
jgi:hypothetical protein